MKADLDKILEALEMINESSQAYYNMDTGEIEWLGEFMYGEEYTEAAERIELGNYILLWKISYILCRQEKCKINCTGQ